jgi:hypothetical protein
MSTYPLADTAVVLFDLYFCKWFGFDSDCYGTAVTASGIYFETLAFKIWQFTSKLRWVIGWPVDSPAITTSQSINFGLQRCKIQIKEAENINSSLGGPTP